MRYAVLFPGQGSQSVGMGADVFATRPDLLGPIADEVLGWSLDEICAKGPDHELVRTDRAQPALYGVSYALWEAFAAAVPYPPVAAAGHSLGEYAAHAAAGAVGYLDGLRVVAARGQAMAQATKSAPGAMAAIVGADLQVVEAAIAALVTGEANLWVAIEAIDQLTEEERDLGLRRVIKLNVAGAFHAPLMESARVQLVEALSNVEFGVGAFPVWANLTAAPVVDTAGELAGQLVGRVRFAESLVAMSQAGVDAFIHIGPSDVTAGMAKRTIKDAEVITVSSLNDIGAAVDRLTVV
jgi:[acyl-carrier-protein] S-malonyltransferase